MTRAIYFSATGSTEEIVRDISGRFSGSYTLLNLTAPLPDGLCIENPDDLVVIGVPVYAGRVPAPAVASLRKISGRRQNCVLICVYGNRAFDDALLELHDIAVTQGFRPVGAAAIVARHSIFPKVAATRPDRDDFRVMDDLVALVRDRLAGHGKLNAESLPGRFPYKAAGTVPLHPRGSRRKCSECGVCVDECPVGAIDKATPWVTDDKKCITCARCISLCRKEARSFRGLLYKIAGWQFAKKNSERRPSMVF
ncbi:MAG: 4Fe-4S binding protein [Bacteroidales bacterium]|nr:4Fe-4S binding protein [Bacteroidales bacterium]